MRRKFLEVETRSEAQKQAPWAENIIKYQNGYYVFESDDEYNEFVSKMYGGKKPEIIQSTPKKKYKEICLCTACWNGSKEKDESCLRY